MMMAKQRPDPGRSLVGFTVGEVHYAVPIAGVRAIVNPQVVTALPHAPPAVRGVFEHRGEVVPVVDLRRKFALAESPTPERTKWLLVEVEARTVGLQVDSVTRVFGTSEDALKPPPELGYGDDQRGILGVTSYEEGMVFVLDLQRFEALLSGLSLPRAAPESHGE